MRKTDAALVADGYLLAPIREDGVWGAVEALREGMRGLGRSTSFVAAITDEGRLVSGQDPDASVLVLGYHSED